MDFISRLALSKFASRATRSDIRSFASAIRDSVDEHDPTEFRTLDLNPARKERKKFEERRATNHDLLPPRSNRMHVDQNWANVWPAAATFKAATVPLPVRMGFPIGFVAPVQKYGNTELMKIPNFLHLTPNHIKTQCAAIKKFCTPWPAELATQDACRRHFPIRVITSDYVHSGQSIRNSKSRIVSMKIPLSSLNLDGHGRDKFLRLVGNRYDPKTDLVTIITDRCPTRRQNYDYACYLITALYFESKNIEPWESEKTVADMERYNWEGSASESTTTALVQKMAVVAVNAAPSPGQKTVTDTSEKVPSKEEIKRFEVVQQYQQAVSTLLNTEENVQTLDNYKNSVMKLLNLSPS